MTYLIESNKDTPKILLGTLTGYSQYNVDCDIWKRSKKDLKIKKMFKIQDKERWKFEWYTLAERVFKKATVSILNFSPKFFVSWGKTIM